MVGKAFLIVLNLVENSISRVLEAEQLFSNSSITVKLSFSLLEKNHNRGR